MCRELKHPLAAADDRQERPRPFVVPVAGSGFDGSGGEIRANVQPAGAEKFRSALGISLKMTFAGTTTEKRSVPKNC